MSEELVCCVCGSNDCLCEGNMCDECSGRGEFVDCIDDLCYGQDECIHGDEPVFCRHCDGEGEVFPKRIPWSEYQKRNEPSQA